VLLTTGVVSKGAYVSGLFQENAWARWWSQLIACRPIHHPEPTCQHCPAALHWLWWAQPCAWSLTSR